LNTALRYIATKSEKKKSGNSKVFGTYEIHNEDKWEESTKHTGIPSAGQRVLRTQLPSPSATHFQENS